MVFLHREIRGCQPTFFLHSRLNLECKKKQSAASNISDGDTEETVILEKKRLNLPVENSKVFKKPPKKILILRSENIQDDRKKRIIISKNLAAIKQCSPTSKVIF